MPTMVGSVKMKPLTFPPGRAKLATNPLPTGSATMAKTMGMLRVCCSSALVVGVVLERMTSGVECDELIRKPLDGLRILGRRPARLDSDIAVLGPSKLLQSGPECDNLGLRLDVAGGVAHQRANPPHPL